MYLEKENKTENSSLTFILIRILITRRLHVLKDLHMSLIKCEWIRKITTEIRKSNALAEGVDKSKISIEEPHSGSLRWETSLGITSRVSNFEKSILRCGRINKTTGNPVVRIMREILLLSRTCRVSWSERELTTKWGNNLGLSLYTVPRSAVTCVVAYFRRTELLSGDQERSSI